MGKFAGFEKVKLTRPQRSTFDLSHERKMSVFDGNLTPVLVTECLPSDSFHGSSEMLVRLAPLLAPIYDHIQVFVHYFFIPNRLIWDEWEIFITGGRVGLGRANVVPADIPVPPQIDIGALLALYPQILAEGTLADYLGVPVLPATGDVAADYDDLTLDLMPFNAYWLVWYHYYRERNFIADLDVATQGNGALVDGVYVTPQVFGGVDENYNIMNLKVRNYRHDYFTSALPFTQRGEEVLIPLDGAVTYLQQSRVVDSAAGTLFTNNDLVLSTQDAPDFPPGSLSVQNAPNIDGSAARIENIDTISNISTTINDFRSAYALQVWLERNAIGGSRYTESTQAHFGVKPQDSRLNRPEYIGGGRISVKISEVVSTAYAANADTDVVPQANMAGHGVTYGNTNRFSYFCTEHGFILGLLSIMVPPTYHQGLPRMFRRRSFLDYPWPTFAKLGEQTVNDYEIFANAVSLTPDVDTDEFPLFGYQSRYAEWKYMCSTNHGDFHSTMMFWTAVRDFGAQPVLGANFNLYDSANLSRVFAVNNPIASARPFWLYVHNQLHVKRPLPYFGTPNTLGFV